MSALAGPATRLQRDDAAADAVLRRLLEGNARFVRGELQHGGDLAGQRSATVGEQRPSAVILGCSDARVPPQLVFDQGPGDLFTTRVAGNVATDDVIGTIEYAVEKLGVSLVLVLGHSGCGAVSACLHDEPALVGGHLGQILRGIAPAVERARRTAGDPVENAIRFNVQNMVERLRTSEPLLAPRVRGGSLRIVGARYDLQSGRVEIVE
jgi:carbonic anhydrase